MEGVPNRSNANNIYVYVYYVIFNCLQQGIKIVFFLGENSYAFHIYTVKFAIRSILESTDYRNNNSFVLPSLTFKPFGNEFYILYFKPYIH